MRKVLHKLIHYRDGGINVVADLNAAISTGSTGTSRASVQSSTRIVQRNGRTWTDSEAHQSDEKEVKHDEKS